MRLNRVLQKNRVLLLAATINILIFALAFTISCSGDDGKNGKNGDSCTLTPHENDNDWDIVCGGKVVDQLHDGDGASGTPGAQGPKGPNCSLSPKGGTLEISCEDGTIGTLESCGVTYLSSAEFAVKCGVSTVYLCKGQKFEPTEQECDVTNGLKAANPQPCGDTTYLPTRQYCGWGPNDTIAATPYDLCNGDRSITSQPNENKYDAEYCMFTSAKTAINSATAGIRAYCNGAPINKDFWAGEYCGWSDDAIVKGVLKGICDQPLDNSESAIATLQANGPSDANPQGPNQLVNGQGYCVATKNGVKTQYSNDLCGTSSKNKPNEGTWKGQYCGYGPDAETRTVVYDSTGTDRLCDDTDFSNPEPEERIKAPHYKAYNDGYCGVTFEDRKKGTTKLLRTFCGEDKTKKPNELKWKNEYCGAASVEDEDNSKLYAGGLCDDGKGPNQSGWDPDQYCRAVKYVSESGGILTLDSVVTVLSTDICGNGSRINEGSWKAEYCGYNGEDAEESIVLLGACDYNPSASDPALAASLRGPYSEDYKAGYCQVGPPSSNPKVLSKYVKISAETTCGNGEKINEVPIPTAPGLPVVKWAGEYCGYDVAKDAPTFADAKTKKKTGACGDGSGPDAGGKNDGYCSYASAEATYTTLSRTYCDAGKASVTTPSVKINETAYKNEMCFDADYAKGTCIAGNYAVTAAKSNSAGNCVIPAIVASCASDKGPGTGTYKYIGELDKVRCEVTSPGSKGCIGKDADEYFACKITLTLASAATGESANDGDVAPDNFTTANSGRINSKATCQSAGGAWTHTQNTTSYECTIPANKYTEKAKCVIGTAGITGLATAAATAPGLLANGVGTTTSSICIYTPTLSDL